MSEPSVTSEQLRDWLHCCRAGDQAARDKLITHAARRLERLTRHMLRGYAGVRRWAETDDVLQGAMLRLLRALEQVQPDNGHDFLGLATLAIRRELLDLARHFYGPQGAGAKHASHAGDNSAATPDRSDWTHEPSRLAEWRDFHEQVDRLPAEERDVVGLLFYQGLEQSEAAALLGVSVRTVQRRWHSALLKLHEVLNGQWPSS